MNPIEKINHRNAQKRVKRSKTVAFYLIDLAVLIISFLAAVYLKRHNFYLSEDYKLLLLVFGVSWLFSSALGGEDPMEETKNPKGRIPAVPAFLHLFADNISFYSLYFRAVFFTPGLSFLPLW